MSGESCPEPLGKNQSLLQDNHINEMQPNGRKKAFIIDGRRVDPRVGCQLGHASISCLDADGLHGRGLHYKATSVWGLIKAKGPGVGTVIPLVPVSLRGAKLKLY